MLQNDAFILLLV